MKRTVGNIEANTPENHYQVWSVSGPEYTDQLDELIATGVQIDYCDDSENPDKRYVTRMNEMAQQHLRPDTDYVFFDSDDVIHHPNWLRYAIHVMEHESEAQIVIVNDMRNPNGTQALMRVGYMRKAVFDDPSAVFHPGYRHNFADTEMFVTAAARGVAYRAPDAIVEHLHPLHQGANRRPWDETYALAQAQWDVDAARFKERMQAMKEALGVA